MTFSLRDYFWRVRLSVQFWLKLGLSFLVLVCALVYINRSKIRFIQKIRAARLRAKLIAQTTAILPVINATLRTSNSDLMPLFKLRANLEYQAGKTAVLFDIERDTVAEFLTLLSRRIAEYDSNGSNPVDIENVTLLAQRTIRELTELS